jgi:hypothetical protein
VTDLSPLSDPEIRDGALRFCLALCRRVDSDDAEERDELAREIDLAVLDLQRKVAAHGFSWDEIADPLADLLLLIFSAYRLGIEAGIAIARHGPK